jgi:hypothetical protein
MIINIILGDFMEISEKILNQMKNILKREVENREDNWITN